MGEISSNPEENESLVENCQCPKGYAGLSCEKCEWGYVNADGNDSGDGNQHECIKCDCNGHSASCDLLANKCHVSIKIEKYPNLNFPLPRRNATLKHNEIQIASFLLLFP